MELPYATEAALLKKKKKKERKYVHIFKTKNKDKIGGEKRKEWLAQWKNKK